MGWFLDHIVLKASRHAISADGATRRWIERDGKRIESFTWPACFDPDAPNQAADNGAGGRIAQRDNSTSATAASAELHVVKFVGAAGRAENASLHPFDQWPRLRGAVTVANPPGYGNSPGRARLEQLVPWAVQTFDTIAAENPRVPILLSGSSLGATVALCVAAARPDSAARGLLIRDAPQIKRVIWQRFGWQSGWFPALMTMSRVPESLDAVAAASACSIPAVIVSSGRDRIVPPNVQKLIIEAYGGPKLVIRLPQAGHYDPMEPSEVNEYAAALDWLLPQVV